MASRVARSAAHDPPLHFTAAAFEAIADTLPLGSVGYEAQTNAKGERLVWLEAPVVDRLAAMRGPGESYSDVILRLVEMEVGQWA